MHLDRRRLLIRFHTAYTLNRKESGYSRRSNSRVSKLERRVRKPECKVTKTKLRVEKSEFPVNKSKVGDSKSIFCDVES